MSLRASSYASLLAALTFAFVACGGSTSNVGDGGTSGTSGTSGSSGTSGTSGDTDGGAGGSCTNATLPGDRACVPGLAQANVPIEIAVDAMDGCLGCFTTFDPCKVDVSGQNITLSMITRSCSPPGDQACPAVCALPGTTCKLPALAAGTYTVKVTGDKARTGLPPRELVVTNDAGGSSSCKLPQPGTEPPALDGKKYGTSCTLDTDCRTATVGSLCSPCKCPNLAIAKTESAKYEADYRAGSSLCHASDDTIACAACPPPDVTCVIELNALTGTCTLN